MQRFEKFNQLLFLMTATIKIKKGLDIKINGQAEQKTTQVPHIRTFEIIPDYYHGIIPKMDVKAGEKIQAGTSIFHSKVDPDMNFVSPVSGTIREIVRGERRKVMKIVIETDETIDYKTFDIPQQKDIKTIKALLLESGLWTLIKQRPYDVIANPQKSPKAIFISTFDTAPLAPNYEYILNSQIKDFQEGIDTLLQFSEQIHLGLKSEDSIFNTIKNVEKTIFVGKHPAGNVGIHINHTDPINKEETVWTINPQDIAIIGRFMRTGKVDFKKTIALTGPEVSQPQYIETIAGNSIEIITKNRLQTTKYPLRYISGNVLVGDKISENGFLSPYANQLSIIDEGSQTHELLGWAMPRLDKFSTSRLFLTKLFKNKTFKYDARLLGGRRAIIMSNEYDKVFPMDILPEQLIKAMIAQDIDKMEQLGIYEVVPEDFALCEFVDTSKLPLQAIVRESLDYLRKEIE